MFELINIEVKDSAPERVYVFPQRLTPGEISENVEKLHTIANEDSDRTIYCSFDGSDGADTKFEVCFPISHLDFKKYNVNDFKILPRDRVISAEYMGDFSEISQSITQLIKHAEIKGLKTRPPYKYLFILHKKSLLSKQTPKFTVEINIPIIED